MSISIIARLAPLAILVACSPTSIGRDSEAPPAEVENLPDAACDAQDVPGLCINEFMAHDDGPDWIEIHNGDEEPVSMAGMLLWSEDGGTGGGQQSWNFPEDLILEPGAFLLVICDQGDGEEDGQLHASFCIERQDGTLLLLDESGSSSVTLNAISYGYQVSRVSSARWPDGGLEWVSMEEPTPGSSNSP